MKYGAEAEQQLMTEVWSPQVADDPYNFVMFIFPWGQKDTPLEEFTGHNLPPCYPRYDQRKR